MSAEKTKQDADKATQKETDRAKQQLESSIVEPVRAYGSLTTNYYEELFSTQFDAVRAFAETSLAQSRSWLEVKDSESFRKVVEEQQQSIKDMSERLKADTDRISSLSQEYLKESQQLAMSSMQTGQKQLEENMQKGQQQLQENLEKGQAQVRESMQKGKGEGEESRQKNQQHADKSKKSTSTSEK